MRYKSPGDTSDGREEDPCLCAFDCLFPIPGQSSATPKARAKVRSTAQRRGSTSKPSAMSERLTIQRVQRPMLISASRAMATSLRLISTNWPLARQWWKQYRTGDVGGKSFGKSAHAHPDAARYPVAFWTSRKSTSRGQPERVIQLAHHQKSAV